MLIWQDQQNVATFLGTVPALLGADASGNVIGATTTGDVVIAPGSMAATVQPHVVSYAKMQLEAASTLLGNPSGVLGDVREITLGTGLSFAGNVLNGTAAITWPAATDVLVSSGTGTAPVGDSNFTYDTTAHTLSLLGSAPIAFGAGTQTIGKTSGTLSFATTGAGSFDFSPNSTLTLSLTAAGQVRVAALGAGGLVKASAGVGQLAIGAAGTDYQAPVTWPTASQVLVSQGTALDPLGDSTFTFDRVAHVQAAGNCVAINGATPPSSVSLVAGISNNTNRDRVQFFVGGGTLGPTGAGDSTLFDVFPTSTSLNAKNVTGGIYATQRIRQAIYPGGNLIDHVSIGASLYVDAAPSFTVVGGTPWGIYVAAGGMHVTGSFECTATSSAAHLVATGASAAFGADGSSGTPAISFFGAAGAPQQTGGAAAAGGAYTATEQGMINRMYSALRTYGLLT